MGSDEKTEMPSFALYILIFFLAPVYYAIRGRWVAFLISGALYTAAFFTFIIIPLSMFFWFLATAPAMWALRSEMMVAHAKRTGEEMAAAMIRTQGNQ